MDDIVDIGAHEAFRDLDATVISFRGDNFYRACGTHVADHSDGSSSSCVKRIGHPGNDHEDFDGVLKRVERDAVFEGVSLDDDSDKVAKINVGAMPGDFYSGEKIGGPFQQGEGDTDDFIRRHLAWERAKELVDLIVERYPLEEYKISPGGFTLGYSSVNTKADQYLAHVTNLANWLLGIDD